MDLYALLWLLVFAVFLVVEAATHNLVTLWFMVGALAAMLVALFGAVLWLQILVFVVVTGLSLYFLFPIAKNKLKIGREKTNVDSLVGKSCVVTKAIGFNQYGQVSISGVIWTASSDDSADVGEQVEIIRIEGNKVIVKKIKEN